MHGCGFFLLQRLLNSVRFRIVAEFSLEAIPIDGVVLGVAVAPMVSMTRIFEIITAHFRLEQSTLPLDHIQFSSQYRIHLVSENGTIGEREREKKQQMYFTG